jgi:hypothetical protein
LGKLKPRKIEAASLPKKISYLGNLVEAIRWKDEAGENLVVFSETDISQTKGEPTKFRDSELVASHYNIHNNSCRLDWAKRDFIKYCQQSNLKVSFIPKAISITDLNKDGVAEI